MLSTPESLLTLKSARAMVRIISLSTGSPVFDDDLAQEALMRTFRAFSRSESVDHPQALFKKIVRDTIYDYWRRRREIYSLDLSPKHEPIFSCHIDDWIDRERQLTNVYEALSRLTVDQRQLLELFYFEELSVSQIAEVIGKSKSAVKMGLSRGRHRIMEFVSRKSLPST